MASGSLSNYYSGNNNNALIVEWRSTPTTSSNSSKVTATVKLKLYSLYIDGRTNNYVTINGKKYYYNTSSISKGSPTTVTLGTVTSDDITHNADGTKSVTITAMFQINANISGTNYGTITASKTVTLDSIPRAATISSAPDFTDEDSPTITYSNKAGDIVDKIEACISFDGYSIGIPYRDISPTGTSYTFHFTDAEKEMLQKQVLSGSNSKQVWFCVHTKIGSYDGYGWSAAKTLSIANAKPTISPTVIDSNSVTKALTGDENKLIRYHSSAAASIKATFKKYATAQTYSITSGRETFTTPTGTFNAVERNSFAFRVVDTRGLTASQTITKDFVEYVHLTCNLEVTRPNALGEMSLKIHGNCFSGSFGAKNNTLTLKYYFQEEGDVEYAVNVEVTPSDDTYSVTIPVVGLDYRKKYTFRASAWDELEIANSATIETYTLPVFDWSKEDFNFNVPIGFNGVRMNDFVIEEGNMAGWNFRRWNSGIAECWFITEPTNLSISTAWGGLYTQDNAFPGYLYPFEFASLPVVSVQPYATDGNFWCFTGSDASTTQSPSVSVVRPTSYSVTGARISMYVIGRELRIGG
jgi:hypothetical protein